MILIIDFFNFLYKKHHTITPELIYSILEQINTMNDLCNQHSIVVFDGTRYKNLNIEGKFNHITVYFALPDADSYIISFISQSPSNKYIVVSDDAQLIRSIKHYAKKHYGTMQLWNQLYYYKHNTTQKNFFYNSSLPAKKTTDFQDNDIDELMNNIKKVYKKD